MNPAGPNDAEPPWPDHFHLDAARGWLGLVNLEEARRELNAMTPASRDLPVVLAFECHVLGLLKDWPAVVALAERWLDHQSHLPPAWIQRSYALHELGRTQEAWDKLLPAATLFPEDTTLAYNLACYACQLGQLDPARRWLRHSLRTCDAAGRVVWKAAALCDRDLEPLHAELAQDRLG